METPDHVLIVDDDREIRELLATYLKNGLRASVAANGRELSAVLQPFYRVEASRGQETGGAGLGLAIAQQLTQTLGGTLTLQNREGGGLEATVRIPGRRTIDP